MYLLYVFARAAPLLPSTLCSVNVCDLRAASDCVSISSAALRDLHGGESDTLWLHLRRKTGCCCAAWAARRGTGLPSQRRVASGVLQAPVRRRDVTHALTHSAQTFQAALPPGSRVICVDAPGCGLERHRRAPRSIAETADDVLARFHAIRAGQRAWSVCGVSLGGMLAVDIAARNPPGLRGAVVMNSSAPQLSWTWERLTPGALFAMLRTITQRSVTARERIMMPLVVNDAAKLQKTMNEWVRLAGLRPLPSRSFFAQLFAAASWRAPATCSTPLLVLCSAGDRLVAPSCSHRLAKHYNCPLEEHPTAGHDITTDAPEWVAAAIVKWAAAIPSS